MVVDSWVFVIVCQLMAHKLQYTRFLLELSDLGCELEIPSLRDCAREILRCIPAGKKLHLHAYT